MIRQVSARASIEEGPGGLVIRIRSGRTHPFLAAGVIGVLAVGALVLLVIGMQRGAIGPLLLLPTVGLVLGYEALWRGFGREDLVLADGRARIERRIGSWVLWSAEFPVEAIREVKARHWPIGLPDPMWRYDSWGLSRGALVVETDRGVHRIGTALGEAETDPLVSAVRARLARRGG